MQVNNLFDLTTLDEYDSLGKPKLLDPDEAISQALKNFITFTPDDYIKSKSGGVISPSLFKVMNANNIAALLFRIKNAVVNDFSPRISVTNILVEPDRENRIWKITIVYVSPLTGNKIQTPIMIKDLSDRGREYQAQDVNYEGSNLVRFAKDQKVRTPHEKLVVRRGEYYFGRFRLVNLSEESPEYAGVREILDG